MQRTRRLFIAVIASAVVLVLAQLAPRIGAQSDEKLYMPLLRNDRPTATATATGTNTPTNTPTATQTATATATQVPPVNVLQNGDFEQGEVAWTFVGAFVVDDAGRAHGGVRYVQLSGDGEDDESIRQRVTVPLTNPVLTYWHSAFL